MGFLEYVDKDYELKLSNRAKSSFRKNKERDLAIIALLRNFRRSSIRSR